MDDSDGGDPVGDAQRRAGAWPEKDVGAIAVGRYGDIIAVSGDPIANIRELEDVDVVIKSGKVEKNRP
jgi:imidazolonepropionase-like amidohydrolase